jgi:hypothetical protein
MLVAIGACYLDTILTYVEYLAFPTFVVLILTQLSPIEHSIIREKMKSCEQPMLLVGGVATARTRSKYCSN